MVEGEVAVLIVNSHWSYLSSYNHFDSMTITTWPEA